MSARAASVAVSQPLAGFVAALRRLRQQAGKPTYDQMAEWTGCSASALCRVQSGRRVPAWGATKAFVLACGGEEDWWLEQYQTLLAAIDTGHFAVFRPWGPGTVLTVGTGIPQVSAIPLHIRGITDFTWYMRAIWKESGLTLVEIAERTADPEIVQVTDKPEGVPVSTLSDLCNLDSTSIPTWRTLCAFLLAVDAELEDVAGWERLRSDLGQEIWRFEIDVDALRKLVAGRLTSYLASG